MADFFGVAQGRNSQPNIAAATVVKPTDVRQLSAAEYAAAKRAATAPRPPARAPFEPSATDRPDHQRVDARALSPKEYEAAKRTVFGRIARELLEPNTAKQLSTAMQMTAAEYQAAKRALIRGA